MAGSASAPNQPCHTRSISLPSRSHPVAVKVEEELHKLGSSMASSSATPQVICDRLRELRSLYGSIEELMHLTSNQQKLIHPLQKRWVEEELDGSIGLLDLCSGVRGCLTAMKEQIQGVQLALRRRDSVAIASKVNDYVRFGRKADKGIKNCFRSWELMEDRCVDKDSDLPTVIRVLMDVKVITISLLQLVSSFLSMHTRRPRSCRWSFVSKALSKRKVASEVDLEDGCGVERLDIFSWHVSCGPISCKDVDGERVVKAQSQLQMLEVSIEGLENGLECLFRQLIHSRASLLNILSL